MVCTANDLQEWKDFPKGLRVLLLERDTDSAAEIGAKLEAMDYTVSIFYDENEALSAVTSRLEGFHIAIVEVSASSSQDGFKFLQNAKDLPTIMTSNNQCLTTMMNCIALGAVEFLSKPLSEDKLRNIWQHVVHKAFNAGASVRSESLRPVKESVESMLQLQTENGQHESRISVDLEILSDLEFLSDLEMLSWFSDNEHEQSAGSDKYPAPSTPQLKHGARLLDDGDCQEQTNYSTEKESGEHDGGSKSVETSCENLNAESTPQLQKSEKTLIEEEEEFANGSKGENAVSLDPHNRKFHSNTDGNIISPNKASVLSDSCENKANRKKMKVDWTPELHKIFLQAVEQLGIDQAIPSRILELMKVEGLTRHNVASHLQKYRIQQRQIMPQEEVRRWQNQRDSTQQSYYLQRPVMAYPAYISNHSLSPAPAYPMWGPPSYPMWQPTESWHWTAFPEVHLDAWGCPVLPPPQAPYFSSTQVSIGEDMPGLHDSNAADYRFGMPPSSFEHYPADEVVDELVKEVMSKPWLPSPLGLKPPSTDSVFAELSKQGISTTPLDRDGPNPH